MKCVNCDKKFNPVNVSQLYCTDSCRNKASKDRRRQRVEPSKDGFFIKNKNTYSNKIVKYDGSPDGEAFIGVNKEPLMPNKEGYGYQGVLLQDGSRQFVQCSSCGLWFKKISYAHIKKCCGLTVREYKQKYGLYFSKGLISDEMHKKYTDNVLLNHYRRTKLKGAKNKKAGWEKSAEVRKKEGHKKTRQSQNIHNTCPEQIKKRLKDFINRYHYLPSANNIGKTLRSFLRSEYGSDNKGFAAFGLPIKLGRGTLAKYKFEDGEIVKFHSLDGTAREEFYLKMKQKCSILK